MSVLPIRSINKQEFLSKQENLYKKQIPLFDDLKFYFKDMEFPYKNYEQVFNIIKNFWNLEDESLDFLEYSMKIRENYIDKDVLNFLKSNGAGSDLRAYFDLPIKLSEKLDESWRELTSSAFYAYIHKIGINYENYANNLINYKGNDYKLKKYVEKITYEIVNRIFIEYIYLYKTFNMQSMKDYFVGGGFIDQRSNFFEKVETSSEFFDHRFKARNTNFQILMLDFLKEYFGASDFGLKQNYDEIKDIIGERVGYTNLKSISEYFINKIKNNEDLKQGNLNSKEFKSFIRKSTENFSRVIGEEISKFMINKTGNNKTRIVVSANPVDFFTCSTGNSFNSCLNLSSTYSDSYWIGLHNTILDRNRVIIYTTNGQEKSLNFGNYPLNGSPKMHNRVWGILTKDNKIAVLEKQYDTKFISAKELNEISNSNLFVDLSFIREHTEKEGRPYSKYELDLAYTNYKHSNLNDYFSSLIYSDDIGVTEKTIDNEKYIVHNFGSEGRSAYTVKKDVASSKRLYSGSFIQLNDIKGLVTLAQTEESIVERYSGLKLTQIDFSRPVHYNEVNDDDDDDDEDHATCYNCGERCHVDDGGNWVDGNFYCETCLNENYCWSEYYGEYISNDDAVWVSSAEDYYFDNDIGDKVFRCNYSEEFYLADDVYMFAEGSRVVSVNYFDNNGIEGYFLNEDGEIEKVQEGEQDE